MSRSGYVDDDDMDDQWMLIRWRGAVKSAIRGKRGQAFLREMLRALDALPKPELVAGELQTNGSVCAIGAVGKARGVKMDAIDPEQYEDIAGTFGISEALAREIMYENDECSRGGEYRRFEHMRRWIIRNLNGDLQPKGYE